MFKITNIHTKRLKFRGRTLKPNETINVEKLSPGDAALWGFKIEEVSTKAHKALTKEPPEAIPDDQVEAVKVSETEKVKPEVTQPEAEPGETAEEVFETIKPTEDSEDSVEETKPKEAEVADIMKEEKTTKSKTKKGKGSTRRNKNRNRK